MTAGETRPGRRHRLGLLADELARLVATMPSRSRNFGGGSPKQV